MKINKYLTNIGFLALAVVLFSSVSAQAQRKRTTPAKKPAATTTAPAATSSLDIKQGAEKVSIQIKNVSKFLYILGIAANGIETADKEQRANKLSRQLIDENNQNKQKVVTSIRNLKAGLAELEVQFRTKPALRPYLLQIQGITDLTTQSEDLATAGRFVDAGRAFLTIVEKLTDTLAAMP